MKTNFKLVAGSVAGMLSVAGLIVGLLAWATAEEASSRTSAGAGSEGAVTETPVEPVPVPGLDHELATTHRAAIPTPVVPAPEPVLPEADPFEPELDTRSAVRVRRLVVSTGVRGHEPTGAANTFRIGAQSRLYAFVDAVNETDTDDSLEVTFEPETGESSGHVSLNVPAERDRFRTWAYTRHIYTPGRWHVVVRDANGYEVARRAFDVAE